MKITPIKPIKTVEQAHDMLVTLCDSMPDVFSVMSVTYSNLTYTYYVKWFDEAEKDVYDDGVSQMKAAGAKAAYTFTPSYQFSAIWMNEGEDGEIDPVSEILDNDEIDRVIKSREQLEVIDVA